MSFMIWIIEELWAISEFFYDAYLEVYGWVWPFSELRWPLLGIYISFVVLEDAFYEFYEWLLWAADRLEEAFSWLDIRSLIRSWLYGIEYALDWFNNWGYWIGQYINSWWAATLDSVQEMIDAASQNIDDLIVAWDNFWNVTWPELLLSLLELQANWTQFWSVTFPTLVSFDWLNIWWQSRLYDIQDLINSAMLEFSGTLEGWLEIRDQVFEFFDDPLKWLYDRLEVFMDRYW